jgi:GNAT superfamily N-acetyltransferase
MVIPVANQMKMRIASDADAVSVTTLVNAAFQVERFFIDCDRINAAKVRAMMGTGTFLLAEGDGAPMACVYVEIRGDRGYFGLLAVDPARQREGLGRRMMIEAEEYARSRGCAFADLRIVNIRAELPPFYRGLGYAETGTEPFAADAEPMQACHFIVMSKGLLGHLSGETSSK